MEYKSGLTSLMSSAVDHRFLGACNAGSWLVDPEKLFAKHASSLVCRISHSPFCCVFMTMTNIREVSHPGVVSIRLPEAVPHSLGVLIVLRREWPRLRQLCPAGVSKPWFSGTSIVVGHVLRMRSQHCPHCVLIEGREPGNIHEGIEALPEILRSP